MPNLEHSRRTAREYRDRVGADPEGLSARLEAFIRNEFGIHAQAVDPALIRESRGEVHPSSRVLKYSDGLAPDERLEVFAHELGHLVLHERLTDDNVPYDPVLGSAYADEGPGAIARYSKRGFEEAQAQAFAREFLCPSDDAFARWRSDPAATAAILASHYGVPTSVVRLQLADALHALAVGAGIHESSRTPRAPVDCDASQLEAARFRGRPALVDAGPGTGKTATLIERVRFACEECAAHPRQILVLTFSDEAARELGDRLAGRFGEDVADKITVATFHGFGMGFLHDHGHHVGLDTDFTVLDEDGVREVVAAVLGRVSCGRLLNLRDIEESADRIAKHIGHCKDRLRGPDVLAEALALWAGSAPEVAAGGEPAAAAELLAVYRAYEDEKRARRRVDFADLILLPVNILEQRADIAAAYREKFPWVLVDEFQDVSRATSRLLAQLCGPENPPWVVGDARQSIYRFRGAAPENVRYFTADFPGAERFDLRVNYRSSDPVVQAANALAGLMEAATSGNAAGDGASSADSTRPGERWRCGRDVAPFGDAPIRLAVAGSDFAEREGIADQVSTWLASGDLEPGDVAVLARRNVDVREIVLALSRRGIRAAASGLLTPEGAAGDLAAVMTLVDVAQASIPRVTHALSRGRHDTAVINTAVGLQMHAADSTARDSSWNERSGGVGDAGPGSGVSADDAGGAAVTMIVDEMARVRTTLAAETHTADGFAMLCAFLFDASEYLRRLLLAPDSPERSMGLVEIVSALSLAAGYRLAHSETPTRPAARLACAERLRARLTEATPLPVAPPDRRDAVRVMTCHASKGLEFPCVIVAGQTVPKARDDFAWLPPSWRPTRDEEIEQADALLFVGVTRAQRALIVSCPTSAGGGPRGRVKQAVPLLDRWRAARGIPSITWDGIAPLVSDVVMGPLWGGVSPMTLSLAALDAKACSLRTYVDHVLGARFPVATRPLYPAFFAIARRAMRRVVTATAEHGLPVTTVHADAILDETWPAEDFANHPHVEIYRAAARRMVRGFATEFASAMRTQEPFTVLDPELAVTGDDPEPTISLDLVAHVRLANGRVVAIGFRPETIETGKGGDVNWSALEGKRLSFVLLERATPGISPRIFSGADGVMRDFRWSQKSDSLPKETAAVLARLAALARLEFATTVKPFTCDRCGTRVGCPHWIGAIM
jgi:DNA helicase-2/ATP-dependent DNA helicase PcrA